MDNGSDFTFVSADAAIEILKVRKRKFNGVAGSDGGV